MSSIAEQLLYEYKSFILIDFETRSRADLKRWGQFRYAADSSTDILCLGYAVITDNTEVTPELWIPGERLPAALLTAAAQGLPFVAHNSNFELAIWSEVMVKKYGAPELPLSCWRDTAAAAAAIQLPAGLAELGSILKLKQVKQEEGKRLINLLSLPKDNIPGGFYTPADKPEDFKLLYEYCLQDIRTEVELAFRLPPMTAKELKIWQLDLKVNSRGLYCDTDLIDSAIALAEPIAAKASEVLSEATGGAVTSATGRKEYEQFFKSEGVDCYVTKKGVKKFSLDKDKLKRLRASGKTTPAVDKLLTLRDQYNTASVAKFKAFKGRLVNSRARDYLRYAGAHTRRWTSQGIQLHNMPRGFTEDITELKALIDVVKLRDLETLELMVGTEGAPRALVDCIRPAIKAAPGNVFICSDYSSIEARVVNWLAEDTEFLNNFTEGVDIYKLLASKIYSKPISDINKTERALGKQGELGLGYGMGAKTFRERVFTATGIKLELPEAQDIVDVYRETHVKIKSLWYNLEEAAKQAVKTGGTATAGKVTFDNTEPSVLKANLPGGGYINYWLPKLVKRHVAQLDSELEQLEYGFNTFEVEDSEGCISEQRASLYGGKLTENITQSIARDLLAEAMLRLDRAGFNIVLHVHDEIVAEEPESRADSLPLFNSIMSKVPSWAAGLPLAVEGWVGDIYHK